MLDKIIKINYIYYMKQLKTAFSAGVKQHPG